MNAQSIGWLTVFALGPVISGCGPSNGERAMDRANEQQAIDAFIRGVGHVAKGGIDEAIATFNEATD